MNKLSWIVAIALAIFALYQQSNMSELKTSNAALEKQVAELKQTADAASKSVNDITAKLAEAQAKLDEAAAKPSADALLKKIAVLQKDLADREAKVIALGKEIEQLKIDQYQTNSALEAARADVAGATDCKKKNAALIDKVNGLKQQLATRANLSAQEALSLQNDLEKTKAALFEANSQLKACQADNGSKQGAAAEEDNLKKQLAQTTAELEKVKKVRDALRDTLASAQTKVRDTMAELEKLKKSQAANN